MNRGSDIAVTVIGGYLGSGKTTLLNHVLSHADERLAVIVNDFGDINIDASLIESADDSTISLANGCICCSLVDGFAAALEAVSAIRPAPVRLMIETSGVALPQQIAAWAHGPGFHLDAVVVVVDAETVRTSAQDRYVGETVRAQIAAGDIVVVNKVDLVNSTEQLEALTWLRALNPDSLMIPTERGGVDLQVVFAAPATLAGRSASVATQPESSPIGHSAAPTFFSRTIDFPTPLSRDDLDRLMGQLPSSIVRAKGWLRLSDRPDRLMLLQRVGARWNLTRAATEAPEQLVFISTDETSLDELSL